MQDINGQNENIENVELILILIFVKFKFCDCSNTVQTLIYIYVSAHNLNILLSVITY